MNNCKNEKCDNICECCPKAENYKFRFYYIEINKYGEELKYFKDIIANNVFEAQSIFLNEPKIINRKIKVLAIKKYIIENGITKVIEVFNREGEIKQ